LCCWCARLGRLSLRFICHSVPLHSFVSGLGAGKNASGAKAPSYSDALTARPMSRRGAASAESCAVPRRSPAPVQPVLRRADAPRRVRR
jgi:hypothetical protein